MSYDVPAKLVVVYCRALKGLIVAAAAREGAGADALI